MMTIYEEITNQVEDLLNAEKELFEVKYLNNTEQYNADNLVFDDKFKGVSNVLSSSVNIEDSESKTITMQFSLLIPIGNDNYTYGVNTISKVIDLLTNTSFELSEIVRTTNVQIITDRKHPTLINGVEYHEITFTFESLIFPNWYWSNESKLTIDNERVDSIINVSLNSQKQTDGKVYQDGIVKPQNQGVQIALTVQLIYNKNSEIHRKLLADYKQQNTYSVNYIADALTFNETCQLTSYTLNAITGDTMKLQLTFMLKE